MKLSLDVDARELLRMLAQLPPAMEERVIDAARVTGQRIQQEAQSRVARRTGQTAAAITVDEHGGSVRVYVGRTTHPANLPGWLEFGTRHMTSRPFLFVSARLEEGAHFKRVAQAVQDAIDEVSG